MGDVVVAWIAVMWFAMGVAHARPGGGQSYSGGGYRGGGYTGGGYTGGGYTGGRYLGTTPSSAPPTDSGNNSNPLPVLGTIAVLLVGCVLIIRRRFRIEMPDRPRPARVDRDDEVDLAFARASVLPLAELRRRDPRFSRVAFEDFAFRLFSTAHRARHDLDCVAPYVGQAARRALSRRAPRGVRVEQVIVGALGWLSIERVAPSDAGASKVRICLELEANIATADHTYFSIERWWFVRDARAQSKPPGATRTFPCPHCGAPWQASRTGTQACASCYHVVDNGRFDWLVDAIEVIALDERPPSLTVDVDERSADLRSVRQPDIDARWSAFLADAPPDTEAGLQQRLSTIYAQLNAAWSNNELGPARAMVSDGLYDYLQYWIDAYRKQGLRNQLTDMRIERTEITQLELDAYFEAVTIRIFARGKDATLQLETGRIVLGSTSRDRPYSEYWTLVRPASAPGSAACPHCGAPLAIDHAGDCAYCASFVAAPRRDWILAKIEQADRVSSL